MRFPRVAKAQPWAGIGERFQRNSSLISLLMLVLGSIATLVPGINEAAEVIKEHMEGVQIGVENSEEN